MKRVLLKDVSESLGVSKTLISFVLNGKAEENGISLETQKRVLKKVEELGYKANPIARYLRTGKTETIGLIVSDISNEFYAHIARYIENFTRQFGCNIFMCSTDEDEEKEKALIKMMKQRKVDGLIISSSQIKKDFFSSMLKEGFPFVLIDRKIQGLNANFVGVDNYSASFKAIQFLKSKGYKNITAMAVSPYQVSTIFERIQGYNDSMKQDKLLLKNIIQIPFNDIENSVKNEILRLFKTHKKDRPQALFTINNNLAKYVLKEFSAMNIRIPEDIALITFDDIEMFSIIKPGITAIAQPIENICKTAVKSLFEEINNKEENKNKHEFILPTQLIVRNSV